MESPFGELAGKRVTELGRLFEELGFDTDLRRKPESPCDAVIGVVNCGSNRQRQIAAVIEGEQPSVTYYLSDKYVPRPEEIPTIDIGSMHWVGGCAATIPIDPAHQARVIREFLLLANPDDPLATSEEIRATLAHITDVGHNSTGMGNHRGDDLRAIGHILHRLLDRVERLEKQVSSGQE